MIALLFLVGFIALHWGLILTVVLIVAAARYGKQLYEQYLSDQDAEKRRQADVAARADAQHSEVMRGNEHGTYGDAWPIQRKYDKLTGT
jgi:membrane protein implicated in regulation of membrane protease activity